MRIYIIGPSGSGKSWLAKRLSEQLNIPHIQVDLIWAKSGGLKTYGTSTELPRAAANYIIREVSKAMQQSDWVLDGNYSSTVQPEALKLADTVVMVDAPFWRRLLNNVTRHLKQEDRRGFSTRHFLTRHLPRLIRQGNSPREQLRKTTRAHPRHFIVENRRQAKELLDELARIHSSAGQATPSLPRRN